MSLFVKECVSCFGKKPAQVEKCIIAVSTEFLESQHKTILKVLRIIKYKQFPSFHWLFNWT